MSRGDKEEFEALLKWDENIHIGEEGFSELEFLIQKSKSIRKLN